jgi:hypothetical protein
MVFCIDRKGRVFLIIEEILRFNFKYWPRLLVASSTSAMFLAADLKQSAASAPPTNDSAPSS